MPKTQPLALGSKSLKFKNSGNNYMFTPQDRSSVNSRAIHVGSAPSFIGSNRPEIPTQPVLIPDQPMSEEEFAKIAGIKLVLKGQGAADIEVTDGVKKLVEYLRLPASEYSTNVLKGFNNKITRVDSKTFFFELDKINILNKKLRPIITAIVDVDDVNGGTTLLVNNLKLVADDPTI